MGRNLDMFQIHAPYPLHERPRFRQHDHLSVSAIADRRCQLDGIQLWARRGLDGVRVNDNSHTKDRVRDNQVQEFAI